MDYCWIIDHRRNLDPIKYLADYRCLSIFNKILSLRIDQHVKLCEEIFLSFFRLLKYLVRVEKKLPHGLRVTHDS